DRTPAWHVDAERGPSTPSLDHLVGDGEHVGWKYKTERLCGFEVDDQLEFGRLHDRQVGWFGAFENLASVGTALAPAVGEVSCVTDQAASFGKFTLMVHCRQLVARSKRHELLAMAREKRV